MEHTASPSEVEFLLAALNFYSEEDIAQMLNEISPDIDYQRYKDSQLDKPPFEELKERIKKAVSKKK